MTRQVRSLSLLLITKGSIGSASLIGLPIMRPSTLTFMLDILLTMMSMLKMVIYGPSLSLEMSQPRMICILVPNRPYLIFAEHFSPLLEQIGKLEEALYNIQFEQHWLEAQTERQAIGI